MMSYKIKTLILFLMIGCFSTINCQNNKIELKYNWLGAVSAPQEYPMAVYKGSIVANDFTYGFDAGLGVQNSGWGNEGKIVNVKTENKGIPHQLEFTWYSLVEKKFYTGKWNLNKDKIKNLFAEGFVDQDTRKRTTYKTFVVGLAPKGKVVVWAKGPGNQREVGVFQAHDTIITKEKAYDKAQYMFKEGFGVLNFAPEVQKKIDEKGYPDEGVYETYRERYNWKPMVVLPEGGVWMDFTFTNYNGEQENLFAKSLRDDTHKERAVPRSCGFYWRDKDKNRYAVWIDSFDEKEILELFQKIGKDEEIDLTIKVNDNNMKVFISLMTEEGEVFISKSNIRLSHRMEVNNEQ